MLYQADLLGSDAIEEGLSSPLHESSGSQRVLEARRFAGELVRGVIEHRDEIDARIVAVTEHWDLARMAVVDRNVLRLGTYELLFREDIPPKVSINEAVELAKRYSTAESGTFVNGILDRIMNQSLTGSQETTQLGGDTEMEDA